MPYQTNLEAIQKYDTALSNVRNTYLDKAKNKETTGETLTATFDVLFTLDFIIASNAKTIKFLNFLNNTDNNRATEALKTLLGELNLSQAGSIHAFMQAVNDKIITDSEKATAPLKSHYLIMAALSGWASTAGLIGGIIGLTALAITLESTLPVAGFLALILVGSFVIAALAICSIHICEQSLGYHGYLARHTASLPSDPKTAYEGSYKQDYDIEGTSSEGDISESRHLKTSMEKPKTELRDRFFTSNNGVNISDEVEAEYQKLTQQA